LSKLVRNVPILNSLEVSPFCDVISVVRSPGIRQLRGWAFPMPIGCNRLHV